MIRDSENLEYLAWRRFWDFETVWLSLWESILLSLLFGWYNFDTFDEQTLQASLVNASLTIWPAKSGIFYCATREAQTKKARGSRQCRFLQRSDQMVALTSLALQSLSLVKETRQPQRVTGLASSLHLASQAWSAYATALRMLAKGTLVCQWDKNFTPTTT